MHSFPCDNVHDDEEVDVDDEVEEEDALSMLVVIVPVEIECWRRDDREDSSRSEGVGVISAVLIDCMLLLSLLI